MLSPLLFSAPDVHLRTFGKMWVDGLLYREVWLDNIKKLNTEWSEFTLYVSSQATILDRLLMRIWTSCPGHCFAQR
jgi:hypothetical protein